jgi:hypothetical protein
MTPSLPPENMSGESGIKVTPPALMSMFSRNRYSWLFGVNQSATLRLGPASFSVLLPKLLTPS